MIIGGRYRVIRALATGGMGNVYEAENTRTLRRVAIKTIRPEVARRVSVVQRFEREAQAAGQLRHPNIVDVLDLGDDPEHQLLFIVQEFLVGGDLGACLRLVGTLGPRAALATLLPIMDALTVAHAHGVVHRDLKPDNIFLHETAQGVIPKLIDFGIAKLGENSRDGRRVPTSSLVGSPIYMSPEQARADMTIDARTDVWSMGVVLYETLTGKTPFEGANAYALFTRIAADEPTPLAELAPALPPDLVAVIQRAVTKDRDARWPTMAAFAAALRSCEIWRGVEPSQAARWIVNVAGLSSEEAPERAATELSDKTTIDMNDPGPSIEMEPLAHGSGLWTGEVSPTISHAAPQRPHWTMLLGVLVVVAAAVGGVLLTGRDRGDPRGPAAARAHRVDVVARSPEAVVAPPAELADASAGSAVAVAPLAVEEPSSIATVPVDAGVRLVAPVQRAPARRVLRRPAAHVAPSLSRGFNGSPIVD
jgi:serine/threonine-protein kinase